MMQWYHKRELRWQGEMNEGQTTNLYQLWQIARSLNLNAGASTIAYHVTAFGSRDKRVPCKRLLVIGPRRCQTSSSMSSSSSQPPLEPT